MTYIFFFEITATGTKRKDTIIADNFRIARNLFFNEYISSTGYKVDAVYEMDKDGNLIKIYH